MLCFDWNFVTSYLCHFYLRSVLDDEVCVNSHRTQDDLKESIQNEV